MAAGEGFLSWIMRYFVIAVFGVLYYNLPRLFQIEMCEAMVI